ncbi:MAG: DUF4202 domain-containing protein [Bryobacterales bacterium]|nr:DUF4202 domain-containing protein [Bryobacterales bacterium]
MKSPADSTDLVRFHRAIFEIDLRNADDPHFLRHHGHDHLKEQLHAELVTQWLWRLTETPPEALLLAARAHHLRRWAIPREDYPTGRAGYHQWRLALKDLHAAEAAAILTREGYPPELVARVQAIIQRRQIKTDAGQQLLEDAICLTFLETQLGETAAKLPEKKMEEVLRKTLGKMSPHAVELARHLHYTHELREMLERVAIARG